ncbi:diaminobutyrate acetyltransferase [Effusibacillus consociatus]|uniref:L-2,4-diaminobutyric acid acetyltransferase n=1 Tax=Effusibacillus consociatus TaxID=1117041 RepID=A0ABV9Q8D6_9BACL
MTIKNGAVHRVRMREPRKEDGGQIWELVRETGVLDLNSPYAYLMLCKFFSSTCVVAEERNQIVGFVSAFRPPTSDDTIFVWQIGVSESHRGSGLGMALLKELISRDACAGIRYLEATVSPSNLPSQSLFRSLSREFATDCEVVECFPAHLFPGRNHQAEMTFRVGPFKK